MTQMAPHLIIELYVTEEEQTQRRHEQSDHVV
jgi:hypothetical protein